MNREPEVVVVGAGVAGLTVIDTLRARGFAGAITWVGDELHLPYSRPALSKQVLTGVWQPQDALLIGPPRLEALDVTRMAGTRATGLDLASRRVRVGAAWLRFRSLVIATGLSARRPFDVEGAGQVRVLRTLDDAAGLAAAFRDADSVAILGTGILGCEIASAARHLGLRTTLVERQGGIGLRAFGDRIGARVQRMLGDHGVDVLLGREVSSAGSESVTLTDGTRLRADLVVAAVGSDPATAWLAGTGLDLSDGVLCDERGEAAPGVYAVGDVARWRDPITGRAERVEHQTAAIEQAQIVAGSITGGPVEQRRDPLLWTELFGTRILAHGVFPSSSSVDAIAGDLEADRFIAQFSSSGVPTGLVGWNMPREFRAARAAALRQHSRGDVVV